MLRVLEHVACCIKCIKKFLSSKAVGIFGVNVTASQLLARANGEILNPNMELLFGGPTLRNFRFNYKFTPRNEKEAEQVKLIIRAFKRNMAPKHKVEHKEVVISFLKLQTFLI